MNLSNHLILKSGDHVKIKREYSLDDASNSIYKIKRIKKDSSGKLYAILTTDNLPGFKVAFNPPLHALKKVNF